MKILVVDDDSADRTIISTFLRQYGHEVLEASDGEAGWRILERRKIGLVVSDWLYGFDLCKRIREAQFDNYIYVILSTAACAGENLIRGMNACADDVLLKPVLPDELQVRLRIAERVLRLEHSHRQIEDDMRAAAIAQKSLLPPPALKALGVECKWCFHPSGHMSGDSFNFFALDDRHVGFYLLDVSGHGLSAAMWSVALSMALTPDGGPFRTYDSIHGGFEVTEPRDVIADLNRRFQTQNDRYFAMTYGLLNLESSLLHLAQAGNPDPLLIEAGGTIRKLTDGGMPVGLWPDMDFDCIEIPFTPGDRLVLYSDGISDCTNARQEEFGDQRMLEYLCTANPQQPLDSLVRGLEQKLLDWQGSTDFTDDVSLLAVELHAEEMQ